MISYENIIKKKLSDSHTTKQKEAAQRGGRVTIPGAVQKTFRCYTKGLGLVGKYW